MSDVNVLERDAAPTGGVPSSTHPLDPLTPEEIRTVISILRETGAAHDRTRFVSVTLEEPSKEALSEWMPGQQMDRQALVVLLDNDAGKTFEAVVSLSDGNVRRLDHVPGAQPSITFDEFFECEEALKRDPDFQAALAKRGITDFDLLMVDPWSAGNYGDAREGSQRLVRTLTWVRSEPGENGYAHPVLGLLAWVDLDTMKLVHLEDTGVVPVPEQPGHYEARYFDGQYREPPKPLEIIQSEGPTFKVDGYRVEWMGWSFRIGFNAREGLVLHQIGYADPAQGGRVRSIMNRLSVSEMVVPYGDPDINYARRNAFDVGEYGIGMFANSLKLGCDCLGVIRYFDAHFVTGTGETMSIENAVCMHEEDAGVLWKHTDWRTNAMESRRSRRLIISFIATVGNYEYGYYWSFYLDGTIQLEIKMTGILNTGALAPGESRKWGIEVAPRLYAPIHQHIFNIRMDMALDGLQNSAIEVNTKADPMGPENPFGNAYYAEETVLKTEQQGARDLNLESARYWKIVNPNVTNSLGQPVGYKLMPGDNTFPFLNPDSSVRRRAGFMNHHFWVTASSPDERFAAGDYPNQSDPSKPHGLPAYVEQNRNIENTSITAWHTIIAHHIVRPEDWPVMPAHVLGFHLKPVSFFDRNPAIDLGPSKSTGSVSVACCGTE